MSNYNTNRVRWWIRVWVNTEYFCISVQAFIERKKLENISMNLNWHHLLFIIIHIHFKVSAAKISQPWKYTIEAKICVYKMRKFQWYCDYGLISSQSTKETLYLHTYNTHTHMRTHPHTRTLGILGIGRVEVRVGDSKRKEFYRIVTRPWEMSRIDSEVKFKKFRNKGTKNKPNVKYDFWIRLHEKRINNLQHKLRRKSNRAESIRPYPCHVSRVHHPQKRTPSLLWPHTNLTHIHLLLCSSMSMCFPRSQSFAACVCVCERVFRV